VLKKACAAALGKIRSFRVKTSQDSFGYLASVFPKMTDFPVARDAQPFFSTLLSRAPPPLVEGQLAA